MNTCTRSFSARRGGAGQRAGPPVEEEAWLDEAIAHLAEDSYGFSTSNIDYRVSAFLARPERYQLVVDDYYAADLFRSHGNRGSTYLFLRWCARTVMAPELLPALVHSGCAEWQSRGMQRVDISRGCTGAGRWICRNELRLGPDAESQMRPTDQPTRAEGGLSRRNGSPAGPGLTQVAGGSVEQWTAAGHNAAITRSSTVASGAIEIEVAGPRKPSSR